MENQILESPGSAGLEIGEETQTYLYETKRWANFLAILGFIFVGLIVVLAFSISTILSSLGQGRLGNFPGPLFGAIYLVVAVLNFFPVLYLYRFADHLGKALAIKNPEDLTAAFKNLKSHYRYIGIVAIVVLSFYVLAFAGGIIAALMIPHQ